MITGFHDCVGGCNGCINFNNPDNNGLSQAVNTLSNLYTRNNFQSYGATLADFWAMAASVAVSAAVRTSNSQRNNGQSCTSDSCPGPWVLILTFHTFKMLHSIYTHLCTILNWSLREPNISPNRCPVPCMSLSWGRVTAATCTDEPALPSPTMNASAMYSYFQQQFGFTQAQVLLFNSLKFWPHNYVGCLKVKVL